MTWTKLGDEYGDETRDLTDAEYRTHTDALGWSNRRGLDLLVPKRDLRKFGESPDAEAAPDGLIAKGWWEDRGDCWNIGLRFPEWQLERAVVKQRKEMNALRVRRSRMHKAGDHSICIAGTCPAVTRDVMHYDMRDETHYPGRVGSGQVPPDPQLQNQDPSQDQKPDALRLSQVRNSQKPASSRLNDQQAAADDQHFPDHAERATTTVTGARTRARQPSNPAA